MGIIIKTFRSHGDLPALAGRNEDHNRRLKMQKLGNSPDGMESLAISQGTLLLGSLAQDSS